MFKNKIRIAVSAIAVSAACLLGIANNEAFRSAPYKDSVGVWTNGFGNTKNVDPTKKITVERGLIDLGNNVNEHANGLRKCLDGVELYQHEFDAYLDLAYNVGYGAVCRSSIKKKLQSGQYEAACKTILDFHKVTINGEKVSCHDPKNNCLGRVTRLKKAYKTCMGEAA